MYARDMSHPRDCRSSARALRNRRLARPDQRRHRRGAGGGPGLASPPVGSDLDALRVKIRDEGLVRNRAVHIALGVRADGTKEILGLWLEQNEGAKFWLRVMNKLKNRAKTC